METLTREMIRYWDRRAPSYTEVVRKNLEGDWARRWADMLVSRFPERGDAPLRILDVGTGPGFYAVILAERGYEVTAVDYAENMLAEARKNAGVLAERISFRQMDAQQLDFSDGSFDVVVTRNLTWNLTDPEKAYREWVRVLRPGGVLLNFDANWYAYLVDEAKAEGFRRDRENTRRYGVTDHNDYAESDRMEDLSRSLPMTRLERPRWDLEVLAALGCASASAETEIFREVWSREEQINYASNPGFLIRAVK